MVTQEQGRSQEKFWKSLPPFGNKNFRIIILQVLCRVDMRLISVSRGLVAALICFNLWVPKKPDMRQMQMQMQCTSEQLQVWKSLNKN